MQRETALREAERDTKGEGKLSAVGSQERNKAEVGIHVSLPLFESPSEIDLDAREGLALGFVN